ncbi:MAG: long-chain fatty acid--CoA ligase [Intrasporangiaceae bacterium]|nr:long-chain fatty acid--CoA ligase [Intrasporangiaceae bacterium]
MTWEHVLSAAGYWDGGDLLRVPTSGTTGGAPRLVERTVQSWTDSFGPFTQVTGLHADDVVLASGPASSMFVYARAHSAWLGAETIAESRWRPERASAATVAHLTSTMLADVLELDRSRLRLVVVAGSALAPALRERALARGIDVVEYYGAAELSLVAIGRGELEAFPQVEVEVRDGVIWVRSPWTALGYAGGVDGPLRSDGSWCSVGDRGVLRQGVLTVNGRDDIVTTGGRSVPVADVEAVLRSAPGVREVAVLGVPQERLGEVLAAVVVGGERQSTMRHVRERLPREQCPVHWFTAERLPSTAAGKVSLPDLRLALAAGEVRTWT